MEINRTKTYWCVSGSSHIVEIALPGWMINDIARSGDNTPAVRVCAKTPTVQKEFEPYSDEEIRKVYDEVCYVDNNPDASRQEMIEYLLWDACWDAVDAEELEEVERDEE